MKFLLALFFFSFSVALSAQSVEYSNPSKLPAKTGKFKVIGKNNDGIVVRLYGAEDVIDVYDNNLRLVTAKTIEFKGKSGLLQHIMLNKTGAVIFYLTQEKKFSVLLAQPVNSKFVETGKPVVIDTIFDRKDLVASNLRFKTSVDQNYLTVYYPYFTGSTVESVKFIGVGRSLNVTFNITVTLNRKENELEESKTLVDNNGNTFFLLKPYSGDDYTKYEIIGINNTGYVTSYAIVPEKKLFGEPMFETDNKNGNLLMTAFYDDQKRVGESLANGFMYMSIDPANGTVVKSTYAPFSTEFIAELTGRSNVTNKSLYTFNIRKSVLRNDGGALIIAESFIRDTREIPVALGIQPGYTSYRTSEIFQFNDIIAFSFNAQGEIEWNSIMRKKQASEDDNGLYSSFLIMNEKERMRFLYLDDISTIGAMYEYVLKSTGQREKKLLFYQEDKDVMLLPKMGKQISPDEVVIPSYKGGFLRLVKFKF